MTTKIPKKSIQKWIDALRSGEYKQTQFSLQDEYGYCCLGVACEVFIPKKKQERHRDDLHLFGVIPEDQSACPEWVQQVNDDFSERTGVKLIHLNDRPYLEHDSFTFDEIADLLQAVYIEEVLSE